jgi:hypothetical protein
MRAKRGDPVDGYMTVQQMVEFLRDAYDTFKDKIARGTVTLAAGNTSVTAAIGANLGGAYSVVICPTADPGSRFWVSAKASTQFQVNLSAAAPAGGVVFDWIAKGA